MEGNIPRYARLFFEIFFSLLKRKKNKMVPPFFNSQIFFNEQSFTFFLFFFKSLNAIKCATPRKSLKGERKKKKEGTCFGRHSDYELLPPPLFFVVVVVVKYTHKRFENSKRLWGSLRIENGSRTARLVCCKLNGFWEEGMGSRRRKCNSFVTVFFLFADQ